jgi:endonuclease/exonuclease/phosphatase family metal-dependent hydrolase
LQKELKGWSEALFRRKIAQLASIIGRMKDGAGPEILGVCEVENRYALQALADQLNAALPARNYQLVHVDSGRDQRGIDTAFLFDAKQFTAKTDELFSHWVMRQTGTRDITQITFVAPSGKALVMLANHRIRQEKGDKVAVIALGDFNDEPFDKSVALHAQALRDKGDVTRARSAKFYNLSWEYLTATVADHKGNARLLNGTLYFAGDAALFDQILVSPGLLTGKSGWRTVDGSARIEAYPPMVSHRVGEGPIRFGLPDGDAAANVNVDGYSDHFPVSVRIEEV